jgi:hypothetical protein
MEDVARLGSRNWTIDALNREGWRKLLKEAETHPGCSAVGERESQNTSFLQFVENVALRVEE